MKSSSKTKRQLIDEIATLQARNSELEALEREARQTHRDFGEKVGRCFAQANHMKEAFYVIFDRHYEFINDQFAELFGVTTEEVCQQEFEGFRVLLGLIFWVRGPVIRSGMSLRPHIVQNLLRLLVTRRSLNTPPPQDEK